MRDARDRRGVSGMGMGRVVAGLTVIGRRGEMARGEMARVREMGHPV